IDPHRRELRLHLRLLQSGQRLAVKLVDDAARRFRRQEQPEPGRRLSVGEASLRQRGDLRQRRRARRAVDRERRQLALADVRPAQSATKAKSMRPAITSVIASAPPLNGTCTARNPPLSRKRSALRCDPVPAPGEEKFSPSGFALPSRTRSRAVLKPLDGETTR